MFLNISPPLFFCLTPPDLPLLLSCASLASYIKKQTGLCQAVHSTGKSAGNSAKWPKLMNSRPAGLAQRKSWAPALQEKAGNCPPFGKIYPPETQPYCIRQTITWKTTFLLKQRTLQKKKNHLILCFCLLH